MGIVNLCIKGVMNYSYDKYRKKEKIKVKTYILYGRIYIQKLFIKLKKYEGAT